MTREQLSAVLITVFLVGLARGRDTNQSRILPVLNRVIEWSDYHETDSFVDLCRQLQVPCAEERLSGTTFATFEGARSGRKSLEARKILDDIIAHHPQYKWRVIDGVLVLSPRTLNQYGPLSKLLAHFTIDSQGISPIIGQMRLAMDLPWPEPHPLVEPHEGFLSLLVRETRALLNLPPPTEITVTPSQFGMGLSRPTPTNDTAHIRLEMNDATIRQILNTAVREHGHAVWIYSCTPQSIAAPQCDLDVKVY